jgi:hypothetical protein
MIENENPNDRKEKSATDGRESYLYLQITPCLNILFCDIPYTSPRTREEREREREKRTLKSKNHDREGTRGRIEVQGMDESG